MLDLAGIPVPPIMDGMSLKPLLTAAGAGKTTPAGWRTRFASEFAEGGIQHYGIFQGAAGLYDNPDNQWRMLRVMNATHNLAYMEWDREYTFETIQFHELYDTKSDPWQQHNLWNTTSLAIQGALHAELVNMFSCKGTRVDVSNCHARAASPLLPPAPAPAPPPSPAPSCDTHPKGIVLNNTDISGGDMVRPCQLVSFPGTYAGAQQCEEMCAANSKCVGWTFHLKEGDAQWRCCVKNQLESCSSHEGRIWSGIKQHEQERIE